MGRKNDRRTVLAGLNIIRRRAYDLVKIWNVRMTIHDRVTGHQRPREASELPENDPDFWADLYHRSLVLSDDVKALCLLAEQRYRETLAARESVS